VSSDRIGTDLAHAARVLAAGGLVAFPTETVYGLGADAGSAAAVARIFAAKGRPRAHPLIVHLPGPADLDRWAAEVPDAARRLAARFWPGPLTLVVRRGPDVIDEVTGGAATVGLRVPAHPVALALLGEFGRALAAPSANRFGAVSPTSAAHVAADLGDAVDYIVDGGPCQVGVESTIVDLSAGAPSLLRPGGVPREAIEAVLGCRLVTGAATPAPGTLPSHYAPRTRVVTAAADRLAEVAAAAAPPVAILAPASLVAGAVLPAGVTVAPLPDAADDAARDLYAILRDLDGRGFATIVAVLPDEVGLGTAVADRLRRAAGPRSDPPDPEGT